MAATRTPRASSQGRFVCRLTHEMVYFVGVILFMTVATFVDTRRLTKAAQMHHHGGLSGKPGKLLPLRSQMLTTRTWQGRRSIIGVGSKGEEEDSSLVRGSAAGISRVRLIGERGRSAVSSMVEKRNASDGAMEVGANSTTSRNTTYPNLSSSQGGKIRESAEGDGPRVVNGELEERVRSELAGNPDALSVADIGTESKGAGVVWQPLPGTQGDGVEVHGGESANGGRGMVIQPSLSEEIQSLTRRCPPMFSGPPNCREGQKDMPAELQLAVPTLLAPFKEPFTFLRHMAEGKPRVLSSMPPDWEISKDIGPVDRGLLKVLPEKDTVLGAERYQRCAVVGSSGILLRHENGRAIDAHDLVFRFNSAPTKGFEKQVGSRTTHRITNTRNFGFHESDDEVAFVHLRTKRSLSLLREARAAHPLRLLFGLNPEFHRYMDRVFGFMSTSGLCGIVMALHKCVEVDLYGFHVSESHGVQYHYYNRSDAPANASRDDSEWKVVKAMAESGYVRFMEPCILECHDGRGEACQKCLEPSLSVLGR